MPVPIGETLEVANPADFAVWLAAHGTTAREICSSRWAMA